MATSLDSGSDARLACAAGPACAGATETATSGGDIPVTTSPAGVTTTTDVVTAATTSTTVQPAVASTSTSAAPGTTISKPVPVRLDDWPARPLDVAASPVPYYLPSEAIPDTAEAVRFEFGGTESQDDYVQVWLAGDMLSFVTVVSNISQIPQTPEELRTRIDTTGWATQWDEAFVARTHPAYVNLHLTDVDNLGFVQARTRGLDVETTTSIAKTLRRTPSGELGWDVPDLPPTFVPFAEGAEQPAAFRSITWSDGIERVQAELRISTNAPEDFELGWSPESDRVRVDINGHPGYLSDIGGTVTIGWIPRPTVLVTVGYRGAAQDAMTFARSVSEVNSVTWNSQSIDPPSEEYFNRCHSLWC